MKKLSKVNAQKYAVSHAISGPLCLKCAALHGLAQRFDSPILPSRYSHSDCRGNMDLLDHFGPTLDLSHYDFPDKGSNGNTCESSKKADDLYDSLRSDDFNNP